MYISKHLFVLAIIGMFLLTGAFASNITFAQAPFTDIGTDVAPISGGSIEDTQDVTTALENIAKVMRNVLLLLAVIFVLIAAYNYLLSGGSEDKVATAHSMIAYAAVAVVVAILAFGFESIIRDVIGFGRG